MSTEEEAATAAPASDEPPKKKRKSRFGDAPPAAAAEAASAAPAAAPQAAPSTGVSNPLLAAQQALQANSSLAGIVGAAGPAPNPAGPTPGGGANAIPLGGGPGGAPESEREAPKSTIKPGPERLVGAKELRGLDPAAAVAAAAPKASWDDPDLMGPTEAGVVSETMRIPNEAVGLVIGRSGETIRQLQIRAGADIQVSRDQEGDDRGIIIMGPPENVALAKGLVNRIVAEKLESISGGGASPTAPGATSMPGAPMASAGGEVQFLIPQRHVGLVIGSGGQQIRQLQDNSGARIQVAKDPLPGSGHPPDQRQVTLSGDPACVATAKQMIEALMAQDPRSSGGGGGGGGGMGAMPGGVTKVIEIPNHTVGGVIGAQGRNIRYMQETSGAHIQMQKNEDVAPGAANREVTVEGQQAQVDMAVQLIQREVQQQQNRANGLPTNPGNPMAMRPAGMQQQQPMMRPGGMMMQGGYPQQQQWGGQPGFAQQQMGGMGMRGPMPGYGQPAMGGYNPQMQQQQQQQQQQAMLYQQQMSGPYAAQWQTYYAQQAQQQQQQPGAAPAAAGGDGAAPAPGGAADGVPPPPPPGA